jgi:hypothetical protein
MSALRGLVCFAAGLGIGLTIAVFATPHKGVANRNFLRRRAVAFTRTAARAAQMAEEYAGHSATDEGMAEGPVELHR